MKRLRKVLLSVSAVGVLACTAGAFAACGGTTPPAHEHSWSEWTEKTAATCTAAQKLERNCTDENCPGGGHEEKDGTEALNHDWNWNTESEATCTAGKHETATCKRDGCNAVDERTGDPLNHDWNWTTVSEATCTAGKHETATCKRDGCNATDERTGDPLGHDWTEWAQKTPADCTNAQVLERHCQRDGCEESETKDGTAALDHDWVTTTRFKRPTETAEGQMQLKCNRCGGGPQNVILPVLNSSEYKTSVTPATCQEAGATTYTYTAFGVDIKFDVAIPKAPHNYSGWTVTAPPSEYSEGYAQWENPCTYEGCAQTGITTLPKLDTDSETAKAFYDIAADGDYAVFTVKESVATEKFDGENLGSWRVRNYPSLTVSTQEVNFDTYVFKSVTDESYVLTVPAGVQVEIDNEIRIIGGQDAAVTVTFAAKANQKMYVVFSKNEENTATVTAPFEVSVTVSPGPEIDLTNNTYDFETPQYAEVRKVTVGDIEEGSYTIALTFDSSVPVPRQRQSYFALYLNDEGESGRNATTGNVSNGCKHFFQWPSALSCTITLKKGDILWFKDCNQTFRLAGVTFTLTKA